VLRFSAIILGPAGGWSNGHRLVYRLPYSGDAIDRNFIHRYDIKGLISTKREYKFVLFLPNPIIHLIIIFTNIPYLLALVYVQYILCHFAGLFD
jgi:hypothetical protein